MTLIGGNKFTDADIDDKRKKLKFYKIDSSVSPDIVGVNIHFSAFFKFIL